MPAKTYFTETIAALQRVADSQQKNISAAAELLAETIAGGRNIFSFGATHSFILTEELVYRAGGLALVNPIYPHGMNLFVRPLTATSQTERTLGWGKTLLNISPIREGDTLLIASVSGRNAVVIDMALEARERKIKIIGICSLAYNKIASRHPSGKRLFELCDVVLDNGVPYGDAVAQVKGMTHKIAPISSITGCALVNAVIVEVAEKLVARGIEPPFFQSGNVDGSEAHNERIIRENRQRIFYME
jgi:uncharacterized phosphosugar-binding protein